jgi:hypothetical protein
MPNVPGIVTSSSIAFDALLFVSSRHVRTEHMTQQGDTVLSGDGYECQSKSDPP